MKKILEAHHYSKEHGTIICYLWEAEGFIQHLIPLVLHGGIVYRALKVELKGWLVKHFELSVRDAKGDRRILRMELSGFTEKYEDEFVRFFKAVKILEMAPEDFMPDALVFSAISPPKSEVCRDSSA